VVVRPTERMENLRVFMNPSFFPAPFLAEARENVRAGSAQRRVYIESRPRVASLEPVN
jgi:hypothetical protein